MDPLEDFYTGIIPILQGGQHDMKKKSDKV